MGVQLRDEADVPPGPPDRGAAGALSGLCVLAVPFAPGLQARRVKDSLHTWSHGRAIGFERACALVLACEQHPVF